MVCTGVQAEQDCAAMNDAREGVNQPPTINNIGGTR
jgi:hypothetical protein